MYLFISIYNFYGKRLNSKTAFIHTLLTLYFEIFTYIVEKIISYNYEI